MSKTKDMFPEQLFADGAMFDHFKPHDSFAISDWSPSLTKQEFAEDCDINTLMARYEVTGQLPVASRVPQYIDLTNMPVDLMTAMEVLNSANEQFMRLPAKVRREFDNDPVAFVDFCSDPENLPQLQEWELAPKPAPEPTRPPPQEVVIVTPAPGAGVTEKPAKGADT